MDPAGDDLIHIEELELAARIGVADGERASSQRLTVSLILWPTAGFNELGDQLEKTVDYSAVCREVQQFVEGRRDKLIETLADGIAAHLLRTFSLLRVHLELRKFVLPETKFVAVSITRERGPGL